MIYDNNNIFARIIRKELPSEILYEDDAVLVINDVHPAAPLHILVLPKGEYISFDDFISKASAMEIAHFFTIVQRQAQEHGVVESGYRIVANHGADASQTVKHFHMHILGKRKLGAMVLGDSYHNKT